MWYKDTIFIRNPIPLILLNVNHPIHLYSINQNSINLGMVNIHDLETESLPVEMFTPFWYMTKLVDTKSCYGIEIFVHHFIFIIEVGKEV